MSGDLIDLIYEAGLSYELWPKALAAIAELCGAVSATLVPADNFAGLTISPGAEDSQAAYASYWWRHDIIAQAIFAAQRPGLFCDWRLLDATTRARHPFYQEFRRDFALRDNLAFAADPAGEVRFGLSLQMPLRASEPPGDETVSTFAMLGRHVSRAMLFAHRLGIRSQQGPVLATLMAALSCGAACLDMAGRVLLANPALRAFADDGLQIVRGRLAAASQSDQTLLDSLLRRAIGPASLAFPAVLPLGRPSGRRPLLVSTLPLPLEPQAGAIHDDLPGCRVIVTVVDPEAGMPARTEAALRALTLSPAEARLAVMIGSGLSPQDAAGRLGLTEGTARTRLKQVYAKLGISRQSELARLVTQLSLLGGGG